ncbi:MAG: protein NosL [Bacteroidota bacterium]
MHRRDFLSSSSTAVLLLLAGGCSGEHRGPEAVKLGRDTCELCRMIISDVRFAAEIRGGNRGKLVMFDDIGCAVRWLQDVTWKDAPETEFWVMDSRSGTTWLDARKASYVPGTQTPMDYGFAAIAQSETGTAPYAVMAEKVLARTKPSTAG